MSASGEVAPHSQREGSMQIRLKVYGTLRDRLKDQLPGGQGTVEVADGTTINQLGSQLEIKLLPNCVIMLNGQVQPDRDRQLEPDAELTLIPPVAGG
jgi:molybdopterin converting factor small subunit